MTEIRIPRVLLADDEPHIRLLLKKALTMMNYTVVGEAKNGIEAIELFGKEKPDMLLMDINMPLKTGTEALKEIVAEFPDALVIMLTSVSDLSIVEKCLEDGASNYIRKDTPLAEMKKLIEESWLGCLGGLQ
ncbi:MAG: response regulator transcription factor [Nitrospirae bacterium]|nr:response regulator transcription factor [Nitrospirota bacterium]